ncbi:hypothetical protein CsSME_00041838 [Camellia sinensis var. sinensis]
MWQTPPYRKNDGEAEARPLYPTMLESPELRWAFIRKIYSILALQLLITIAVAAVVITVRPVALFFSTTGAGLALYIVIIITPFIGTLFFVFSLSEFTCSDLGNLIVLIFVIRCFHFLWLQCCALCITITRHTLSTIFSLACLLLVLPL